MNVDGLVVVSGLALVLGAGASLSCWMVTKRMRRVSRRAQEMVSLVERDLRLSALTAKDTDSRVGTSERHARTLKDAQHHLESRSSGAANYGQAITLVRRGWGIEDLISSCGLTRGEAELDYLLHGPGGALKAKESGVNINI